MSQITIVKIFTLGRKVKDSDLVHFFEESDQREKLYEIKPP